jgi:hypothetical protein
MALGLNQPVSLGGITGRKRNAQIKQEIKNLFSLHFTCTVKWPLAIPNNGTDILS